MILPDRIKTLPCGGRRKRKALKRIKALHLSESNKRLYVAFTWYRTPEGSQFWARMDVLDSVEILARIMVNE